ncbi:phenylalanine--tRNA ligase subunit beta [Gemmata sp.]|uniref:phenylalanine--tRNA ligase subunit beta n=1 Tax=Gemmata sp. TaxID=1914242 RepID=UPI003F71E153
MLVPLSWLRDYVAVPDPAHLVERLTIAGLESSGVRVFGLPVPAGIRAKPEDAGLVWERDRVVVAKVLEITKHPEADKLKLVKLDYGAAEPKTVVTGAPNIAPGQSGMKVILGLRGCRYYFADKEGKKTTVTLEPKALRGIMNDAMCMSDYELGTSDEHDGIIILDDSDPAPGTPVADLLGDVVVELDILPNMARCLSLVGVAREVAALTGAAATVPEPTVEAIGERIDGKVAVAIADPKLCPRYSATLVWNAKVGPAPRWMRSRLQAAGMRPINNVVDVTNYVMLEYGQPLHAFDYDVLVKRADGKVPTVIVRPATTGETLKTLDGQVRELSPENLVIADTAGAIALAGVMGGAETEVTADTKNILLESAAFDFVSVRKTARQFNLFSEASTRFSRGVSPDLVLVAAVRAAELLRRCADGEVLSGVVDSYPAPAPAQVVALHRSEIARLLGFDVPAAEVERVLAALQFELKPETFGWTVTVPRTRLDVQAGAADLIEELARVFGYDKLPERLLPLELPEPKGNRSLEVEDKVRDLLADQGLQEAITYSLTSPEAEAKLNAKTTGHVALLNPLSPERSVLRRSLLPGVLAVTQKNLEATDSVALYELGFVYVPQAGEKLPDEPRQVAVVLCGRRAAAAWDDQQGAKPAQYDFYDVKGVVESLVTDLHLNPVTFAATKAVPWLHPMRAAEVLVGGRRVGVFGELHPTVAAGFGLADRAVQVAELDLEALIECAPDRFAYRPFSTFPPAKRDVAVVVPAETPAERVLAEIRAGGGELLTGAELFDVYTGEGIPAGTKSLAFALTYQALDRTLGEKEIGKAHEKVEGRLRHVLKAQIRGKD